MLFAYDWFQIVAGREYEECQECIAMYNGYYGTLDHYMW